MSYSPKTRLLKLGYIEQHSTSLHLSASEERKHPKVFYQLGYKLVMIKDAYYVHKSQTGIKLGVSRRVEFENWREL